LVKFPSPIGAAEEDAAWIADQPDINFDAALLAGTLGLVRRSLVWRESARFGARLARRPQRVVGSVARLAADAGRIATGRSEIEPARRDRRYADRAWRDNAIFKAVAQGHAALAVAIDELLEPADDYRLRLVAINLIEALAPANWPWSNPAAWKAVIDTAGGSLVTGAQRLAEDVSRPPRLPVRSAPAQFKLGEEVAATPGAVVLRTPVMELIQYDPVTPDVKAEPLLVVPSLVNKYYLTDLSPGRSLVEYAVKSGVQMFHISWVNPGVEHRDFDLDTYIAGIIEALDAVRAITGAERAHAVGVCAGGQLLTIALAHLAALGRQEEVASFTLTVAVLDHSEPASPTGLMDRDAAERAKARVVRDGLVDGRRLQAALAWLRPIDSIWWAWVQRYLLIADLPRMDLFYWSEDTTNLPAGLVCDLMELTLENLLTKPGALEVLGHPVNLSAVKVPAYLIAGLTDNLTPWRSCYRTSSMIGSRACFVLVTGGHLQAILRPPGGRSAGFRTASSTPADPDEWLKRSQPHDSSWWDHWLAWIERRSSGRRPAPAAPGSAGFPVLEPAPGQYVARRLDAS
jgi:poly(3-hydroxyalkanoate) synthetase